MATGEPSVRPWRTPGDQGDVVLLEAHPWTTTEAEAAAGQFVLNVGSTVMSRPAGSPSTMTTKARPCDSPAVRNRSTRVNLPGEQGDTLTQLWIS